MSSSISSVRDVQLFLAVRLVKFGIQQSGIPNDPPLT
jgi:hypothetical protein